MRNLALVGLGNLVGGGLLVGAAYAYLGNRKKKVSPADVAEETDTAAEEAVTVPA